MFPITERLYLFPTNYKRNLTVVGKLLAKLQSIEGLNPFLVDGPGGDSFIGIIGDNNIQKYVNIFCEYLNVYDYYIVYWDKIVESVLVESNVARNIGTWSKGTSEKYWFRMNGNYFNINLHNIKEIAC